jgi:hypothetical protein
MSMLLGPSKEALQAAQDSKKGAESAAEGSDADNSAGSAPAIPDHPNAVAPDAVPDHPQAVQSSPEDLAEAEESAKADVKK